MKKRKIFAICDLEEAYVVRLADYLNDRANMPYQVLAFTRLDSLMEYAAGNEIEILLISTAAMTDEIRTLDIRRIIILADGEEPALNRGETWIDKYQDSDSIARQVLSCAGGEQAPAMPENCRILGVYSPVARCGKTLFALTLAQAAGESGKALYINLESYSGFEALFRTTYRSDEADLIYAAKKDMMDLPSLLETSVQTFGSLDIIPPAFFPDDIRDVTGSEWLEFISQAAAAGEYRTVVADIGPQTQDAAEILKECGQIYMPVLPDPVSRAKISQFEKNMEALSMGELAASMVRVYLPEVEVRNSGAGLLDDLMYGKMGHFVRQLMEEEGRNAA